MKNLLILFAISCALLSAEISHAANHYIRSGATGSSSGANWEDAWTDLPTTFVRGDTYYVADGIYGAHTFKTAASDSKEIIVKKATSSDHGTDIGWNNSYGEGNATFTGTLFFTTSNWRLDGSYRSSDWKSNYGFVIDTSKDHSKGIQIAGTDTSNLVFKYVEIIGGGDDDSAYSNDGIYLLPSSGTLRAIAIQYCYIHDVGRAPVLGRASNEVTIEYCWIARNESTSSQHSEGISAYGGTDAWIIRYNVWEDIEGTGIIVFSGDKWEIYGNVFFQINPGGIGNGAIATWTGYNVSNSKVYNNTFVDLNKDDKGWNAGIHFFDSTGNIAMNNLWIGCGGKVTFSGVSHDYNAFSDSDNRNEEHAVIDLTRNVFVDYTSHDFRLASAIPGGQKLTDPYNQDLLDNRRGEDGQWDRSAYEYVDSLLAAPKAPKNLRISSQ